MHPGTPIAAHRPTTRCMSAPVSCASWGRSSPATGSSSRVTASTAATRSRARSPSMPLAPIAPGVRLLGYQDARPCFIGLGTAAEPEVLGSGRWRDVADEGLLYSFDPDCEPAARGRAAAAWHVELAFVDGYAADETVAAARIARELGLPTPEPAQLARRVRPQPHAGQQPAPRGDQTPPLPFLRRRHRAGHHRHDATPLDPRPGQPAGPRRRRQQ